MFGYKKVNKHWPSMREMGVCVCVCWVLDLDMRDPGARRYAQAQCACFIHVENGDDVNEHHPDNATLYDILEFNE